MKSLLFCLPLLFLPGANAAITVSGTRTPNVLIPDNNAIGYTSIQSFSNTGIASIQSITVDLHFAGGWNGDLYCYLGRNGVLSVLLNRVGRSLAYPDGASSSGMTLSLSDLAASDVHIALPFAGSPVGSFQPDGRVTDPLFTLDTDARTASLSLFNGRSADGDWTLFVADQSPGSQSTLISWSLSITGVPEPSAALLGGLGCGFLLRRKRH